MSCGRSSTLRGDESQEILWTGYFFKERSIFWVRGKKVIMSWKWDAKVDGNRRIKSTIGVINQRYIFVFVGNANTLQVVSSTIVFKDLYLFPLKLINGIVLKKTQIDIQEDGTGLVRAKACTMRQSPKIGLWRKFMPVHTSKVHPVSMPFLRRVKRRYILIT